jgi:hypothetical protein
MLYMRQYRFEAFFKSLESRIDLHTNTVDTYTKAGETQL